MIWLLLTACAGSFLTEVQTGYSLSPRAESSEHGGELVAHLGGSSTPNLGIGLTLRTRFLTHGFAAPEVGPHAFWMLEDGGPLAFYVRAVPTVGLGKIEGELGPVFSGILNPGLVFYPDETPLFLSLSLTGGVTSAPGQENLSGWIGLRFGVGVGGVGEDS